MFRALRRGRLLGPRALIAVVVIVLAVGAAALTVVLQKSAESPRRTVMSLFQDDRLLLFSQSPVVEGTLDTLKTLGVDRIRVMVTWAYIAPDPTSRRRPARFDAADPADYPRGGWAPYDRVVALAAQRGSPSTST